MALDGVRVSLLADLSSGFNDQTSGRFNWGLADSFFSSYGVEIEQMESQGSILSELGHLF